jgi:hypothetical protein
MQFHFFNDFDTCNYHGTCGVPRYWEINGHNASEEHYEDPARAISNYTACPYCGSELEPKVSCGSTQIEARKNLTIRLDVCVHCGFWCASVHSLHERLFVKSTHDRWAAAIQRRFPLSIPDAPIHELAEYMRRHPSETRRLAPKRFEQLVSECFRANWKPVSVLHVGQPNDGGVDLVLVTTDEQKWLIQCKRRESEHYAEGVQTVRELLGTLLAEGELKGVVVSTADHFSYHSRRLANRPHLRRLGYEVELVDYGILKEMLTGAQLGPKVTKQLPVPVSPIACPGTVTPPDGPWNTFFDRNYDKTIRETGSP